jgi:DNA-binding Xre family transcriptional regulator
MDHGFTTRRRHVAAAHSRPDPDGLIEPGMILIGRWVRDGRLRAGMSQAQLGRLAGMAASTISRLERGRLEGLRLHRLAAIVAVLSGALGPLPLARSRI